MSAPEKKEIDSVLVRRDIIDLAVRHLKAGHIILYPTDTVWGLGCDAFNQEAVDRIFRIKSRPDEKNMIVLVDSAKMLRRYVKNIPAEVAVIIDVADSPTTVIYPEVTGFPAHLCAADGSSAIRIVQHSLIREIIAGLGHPIISTSANYSGQPAAMDLLSVHPEIARAVHFCVPSVFDTSTHKIPSRIIKAEKDDSIKHIR